MRARPGYSDLGLEPDRERAFIEQPSSHGVPRWNFNVLTRKNDFGKTVNSGTLALILLYLE